MKKRINIVFLITFFYVLVVNGQNNQNKYPEGLSEQEIYEKYVLPERKNAALRKKEIVRDLKVNKELRSENPFKHQVIKKYFTIEQLQMLQREEPEIFNALIKYFNLSFSYRAIEGFSYNQAKIDSAYSKFDPYLFESSRGTNEPIDIEFVKHGVIVTLLPISNLEYNLGDIIHMINKYQDESIISSDSECRRCKGVKIPTQVGSNITAKAK